MGVSSEVKIGYYVKAKTTTATQVDMVMQCSKDPDHNLPYNVSKFCPECGALIEQAESVWEIARSMLDLQCGQEYDWTRQVSDEDREWINGMFEAVTVDDNEGYDYIMCPSSVSVDGMDDAVFQFSVTELTTPPSPEDLERLKAIMQYETIELVFGALVCLYT